MVEGIVLMMLVNLVENKASRSKEMWRDDCKRFRVINGLRTWEFRIHAKHLSCEFTYIVLEYPVAQIRR